jgi:hypothetical protein
MWLPIDHEKYDSRKARDGEKNSDLFPLHLLIVRDIAGPLLGANSRKTDLARRIAVNTAKVPAFKS